MKGRKKKNLFSNLGFSSLKRPRTRPHLMPFSTCQTEPIAVNIVRLRRRAKYGVKALSGVAARLSIKIHFLAGNNHIIVQGMGNNKLRPDKIRYVYSPTNGRFSLVLLKQFFILFGIEYFSQRPFPDSPAVNIVFDQGMVVSHVIPIVERKNNPVVGN
ncbi:MAG: hypothetical protein JXD23_13460, partial [Spirochaetales bacterium]|nr:hypothetical protein [Spirochaetales bacterium]